MHIFGLWGRKGSMGTRHAESPQQILTHCEVTVRTRAPLSANCCAAWHRDFDWLRMRLSLAAIPVIFIVAWSVNYVNAQWYCLSHPSIQLRIGGDTEAYSSFHWVRGGHTLDIQQPIAGLIKNKWLVNPSIPFHVTGVTTNVCVCVLGGKGGNGVNCKTQATPWLGLQAKPALFIKY